MVLFQNYFDYTPSRIFLFCYMATCDGSKVQTWIPLYLYCMDYGGQENTKNDTVLDDVNSAQSNFSHIFMHVNFLLILILHMSLLFRTELKVSIFLVLYEVIKHTYKKIMGKKRKDKKKAGLLCIRKWCPNSIFYSFLHQFFINSMQFHFFFFFFVAHPKLI